MAKGYSADLAEVEQLARAHGAYEPVYVHAQWGTAVRSSTEACISVEKTLFTTQLRWLPVRAQVHEAAWHGRCDILSFLLHQPRYRVFTIKRGTLHGKTPAHQAARNGHLRAIRILRDIEEEAIHATDCNGNTPMHIAAKHCHLDVVKWLRSSGADIDAEDSNGDTPLDVAGTAHNYESFFESETVESFEAKKDAIVDFLRGPDPLVCPLCSEEFEPTAGRAAFLYHTRFLVCQPQTAHVLTG